MSEIETAPNLTETIDAGSTADAGVTEPSPTETDAAANASDAAPAPEDSARNSAPSGPAPVQPAAQPNRTANPPSVEAEYDAIDALTAKYERGEITYEDHAKQTNAINRRITAATIAAVEPVKQTIQQTEHNRKYWSTWGKGTDVAQVEFGKSVNVTKAKSLYDQAMSSVEANPRYANRPEMDTPSIVYAKWLELMEVESKKKPGATGNNAPTQASTRVSGASATATAPTTGMTAREKLDAGVYDQELRTGKFG